MQLGCAAHARRCILQWLLCLRQLYTVEFDAEIYHSSVRHATTRPVIEHTTLTFSHQCSIPRSQNVNSSASILNCSERSQKQ